MPRLVVLITLLLIPRMAHARTEQRVVVAFHIHSGDVAAKDQRWEAAMTEYQAAAELTPGDGRLQSDLSYVAMRAGYFAEAAAAARASIAVTRDPGLLAASLFNYGWALETRREPGANVVALAAYAWAHALDPGNRPVASALAATMAAFAAPHASEADAAQEQLDAGRCARVLAGIEPWNGANDTAEVEPHCEAAAPARGKLPAGLVVVAVRTDQDAGVIYQRSWYLLEGRGATWRVLARLGGEYTDGRPQGQEISGYESFSIGAAAIVKRGTRRVLTLELTHVEGTVGGENDFAGGGGPASEHGERDVLFCVLGAETRCPVRQSRVGVSVQLAPDGTVVATPKRGAPTRSPLW